MRSSPRAVVFTEVKGVFSMPSILNRRRDVCWPIPRNPEARSSLDRGRPRLKVPVDGGPADAEHLGGGGGIDGLGQGPEPDAAGIEVGDHVDQMPQRPAEAVQPLHHQRVPGQQLLEQPGQLRPVVPGSGIRRRSTPRAQPVI